MSETVRSCLKLVCDNSPVRKTARMIMIMMMMIVRVTILVAYVMIMKILIVVL